MPKYSVDESILDKYRSGREAGRKGINYGPGIVIAVATDVTQTKSFNAVK